MFFEISSEIIDIIKHKFKDIEKNEPKKNQEILKKKFIKDISEALVSKLIFNYNSQLSINNYSFQDYFSKISDDLFLFAYQVIQDKNIDYNSPINFNQPSLQQKLDFFISSEQQNNFLKQSKSSFLTLTGYDKNTSRFTFNQDPCISKNTIANFEYLYNKTLSDNNSQKKNKP